MCGIAQTKFSHLPGYGLRRRRLGQELRVGVVSGEGFKGMRIHSCREEGKRISAADLKHVSNQIINVADNERVLLRSIEPAICFHLARGTRPCCRYPHPILGGGRSAPARRRQARCRHRRLETGGHTAVIWIEAWPRRASSLLSNHGERREWDSNPRWTCA